MQRKKKNKQGHVCPPNPSLRRRNGEIRKFGAKQVILVRSEEDREEVLCLFRQIQEEDKMRRWMYGGDHNTHLDVNNLQGDKSSGDLDRHIEQGSKIAFIESKENSSQTSENSSGVIAALGVTILLVHEAKGLEFSDVLCWNFFSSKESCPETCWFNLYDMLGEYVHRKINPVSHSQNVGSQDFKDVLLSKIESWRAETTRRPPASLSDLWKRNKGSDKDHCPQRVLIQTY